MARAATYNWSSLSAWLPVMNAVLFRDLLMNMLLGLTALVVLVMFNINPKADAAADPIDPPGNISVLACWPAGSIDVDTWASAPGQDVATGYSAKSGSVWSLLRDDLGTTNDTAPVNCESMFARATPEGEYVINLHGYSLPTGPVTVHVEAALNSSLLLTEDVELRPKQERTVARFRLDAKGNMVWGSMNKVFRELRSAGK